MKTMALAVLAAAVASVLDARSNGATWVVTSNTTLADGDLSHEGDDVIVRGATLTVNGAHAFASLSIERNASNAAGVLTHAAGFSNGTLLGASLSIAGDVFVQGADRALVGSRIDIAGRGHSSAQGLGAGASDWAACGGGYGGAGGRSGPSLDGGPTYGSIRHPTMFGSGGGNDINSGFGGGLGGGCLRIEVDGALVVDGSIVANGLNATSGEAGGGAGGSLWIEAASIAGGGLITANGGDTLNNTVAGGGGGGRIELAGTIVLDPSQVRAWGGGSGAMGGGAGTIVVAPATGRAQLLVDNGGDASGVTEMSSAVTFDGDLALRNAGRIGPRRLDPSLELAVSGDALVDATSAFYADQRGHPSAQGPGAGTSGSWAGGAAHGGAGGHSANGALGGDTYDSFLAPVELGSGGGNDTNSGYGGGLGGGAFAVWVGGTLTIDGEATADAGPGYSGEAGGGSGGSIRLTCGTLAGSGYVSANGGAGLNGTVSGGGGGGRIAIVAAESTFSDERIDAIGGSGIRGGAGTAWLTIGANATLLIDNGDFAGESTEFTAAVSVPGDLLVRHAARVGPAHLDGSLHLAVDGDATVEAGASIDADGRGEPSASGPGAGTSGPWAAGGGHGGAGGDAGNGTAGGDTYDDFLAPTQFGSGGGNDTNSGYGGGVGGGAIRLSVGGTLTVDGRISADGFAGTSGEAGGAAGGGLWIDCGSLAGAGFVTSNGGAGLNGNVSGGGGGGRIAMIAGSSTFDDTHFNALGGGGIRGGAGTTWYVAGGVGTLLVDNGGNWGENTEWTGPVSIPGHLLVRGAGRVGPKHGDPTLAFEVQGDATVASDGALHADARGAPSASGPGAGASGPYGAGGGHGGAGGNTSSGYAGGGTYGDLFHPSQVGSGGGNDTNVGWGGGRGGGVLRLTIGGTLTVDGVVSAAGEGGLSGEAGGGSGGSIDIACASIAGTGAIAAIGGAGSNGSVSGGGGGGRIAVVAQTATFPDAQFDAHGGSGLRGGAGTAWFVVGGSGTLFIDNEGFSGEMTELSGDILIPGAIVVRHAGRLGPVHGDPTFNLYASGPITVASDASIDADGRGYPPASGPGAGTSAPWAAGGGHGGKGGNSASGAPGGGTYGSVPAPSTMGSGGGNDSNSGYGGGAGGGVLTLATGDVLTVEGRVSAYGQKGQALEAGGAAGGSILVYAAGVAGAGTIAADGGAGSNGSVSGGGGGGRVAIYTCGLTMNPANIHADGAALNGQAGSAELFSGTVDVTLQPEDTAVDLGATAHFAVEASGDGEVAYHWRHAGVFLEDGGDIDGAYGPHLTIANAACADAGDYDCVVTDECGFRFTEAAVLTVVSFGDLDGDCYVGAADLAVLLGQWGGSGPADLNGDGAVGPMDLAILLGAWNL